MSNILEYKTEEDIVNKYTSYTIDTEEKIINHELKSYYERVINDINPRFIKECDKLGIDPNIFTMHSVSGPTLSISIDDLDQITNIPQTLSEYIIDSIHLSKSDGNKFLKEHYPVFITPHRYKMMIELCELIRPICLNMYFSPILPVEIPEFIWEMNYLEELWLSKFKTFNNFHGLSKLKNLKKLYLSYMELREIPVEIMALKKLEWLDLSSNLIREIPDEIRQYIIERNLSIHSLKQKNDVGEELSDDELDLTIKYKDLRQMKYEQIRTAELNRKKKIR